MTWNELAKEIKKWPSDQRDTNVRVGIESSQRFHIGAEASVVVAGACYPTETGWGNHILWFPIDCDEDLQDAELAAELERNSIRGKIAGLVMVQDIPGSESRRYFVTNHPNRRYDGMSPGAHPLLSTYFSECQDIVNFIIDYELKKLPWASTSWVGRLFGFWFQHIVRHIGLCMGRLAEGMATIEMRKHYNEYYAKNDSGRSTLNFITHVISNIQDEEDRRVMENESLTNPLTSCTKLNDALTEPKLASADAAPPVAAVKASRPRLRRFWQTLPSSLLSKHVTELRKPEDVCP